MKAMLLAAGRGERLMPLTQEIPKPLFPVANLPVIRYNIAFLRHFGVEEIVVNLYHLPRLIEQELGDGSNLGVRIIYSREDELWGTGGGLKMVERHFADQETFILMNADVLVDIDLEEAVHFHRRQEGIATMVLTSNASVQVYGAVDIDETGLVRNIAGRIEDVRESPRTAAVFTGIHILTPRVFEYIPPNINSCINEYAYPKMIKNGERVTGFLAEGFWTDLGRPETYYTANMAFLDRKINFRYLDPLSDFTLKPTKNKSELVCLGENVELGQEIEIIAPLIVGHHVRIGDQARIGPYTVIGNGCQIGKQAQVSESILFAGAKVAARQKTQGMVISRANRLRVSPLATNTQTMETEEEPEKK